MSDNTRSDLLESLSAMADGEATEIELRRVLKEEEHSELIQERWSQYQGVGSLLRGEPMKGADISSAVMNAIEAEPKPSVGFNFFKPFGQVAVAASVAALALFGVQQYQLAQLQPAVDSGIAEVELQTTPDVNEFTPPVGFEVRPQTSFVSTNPEVSNISDDVSLQVPFDQQELYEHVNQSILSHSENASGASEDLYPMLRAPNEE